MTNQLIRLQAKDIAGAYYDHLRVFGSQRFARENPDQNFYVAMHWPHFVQQAKEALVMVLMAENTPQYQKDVIEEALLEHATQSQTSNAVDVLQISKQPREREDVRHVDDNPQLRSVGA